MPEDVILAQGPGYTIAQTSKWGPPVPYPAADRASGDRNHGFLDLRDHPEFVAKIPEAQKCRGLAEFLRAVNMQGSPLMTLGCECAFFPSSGGDQPPHAGAYIDLTFRDPERNAAPADLVALAHQILKAIPGVPRPHIINYEFIVEPLRGFFDWDNRFCLIAKPLGFGATETVAWAAMDTGALVLAQAIHTLRAGPISR